MKVTTALAIIIPLALICIGLLLKIICCKTCNCHLNRSQLYNFKDRNIAGTRSCKSDTEASANSVRYVNNSTAGHACSL